MEKAVAEDLVERRPRRARDDVGGVVAGRGESLGVAQRRALDALGGEHPPRRPPPVHLRNPEARVPGEILRQLRRRRAFQRQVHLDRHRVGENLHRFDEAEAPPPRARALHRAGEPEKQLEIAPERALDAGPQHLDRDRTPVRGDRIVDLGDGSRGDGAIVERVEQRLHRRAEFDGDRRPRLFRWKGRQAIAKPRQIGGGSRADQIGPGGKRLTQFDETGAQRHSGVGERLPETLFRRAAPRQQPHRARQPRRRRADSFERRKRIVPRQHARHPRQTPEIEKSAGHQTRQPQCNRTIPPHSDRDRAPAKPARTSAADNTSGGGKRRMLSARYS